MAKLMDTPPDQIRQLPSGQWLFYFTGGKDVAVLPVGAEYQVVVYSPASELAKWAVTRYRMVAVKDARTPRYEAVERRDLTAEEIAHFEKLIADMGGE
jgi:hypothetical protein